MSELSSKLREKRKQSGLKVSEVLYGLKERGVTISDKTLYNWETGFRTPSADEFLQLCEVYNVKSFSEFEETKKAPAPEGAEEEEKVQMVVQGLTRLLVEAGWIAPDADLTDAQLRTLASYVIGLSAYFNSDL